MWLYILLGVVISVIVLVLLFFIFFSLGLVLLCFRRNSAWSSERTPWVPHYPTDADVALAYEMIGWFKSHGEDVYITSHDGLKLHAKFFRKDGATKTILLVHGYRGRPEGDFCMVNHWLKDQNYNFLEIDQRGHSQSEGKYILMGTKEKEDIHSWVDYLCSQSDNSIYLWGLSMGCATVLMSLDKKYPDQVKGIVADCGYYNAYEQLKKMIAKHKGAWAAPIMIWFCSIWAFLIFHVRLKKTDTRKALQNNKLPIFFAHGLKDNYVPCYMTERNYAACPSEKYILLVPDAYHARCFFMDTDEYLKYVNIILNK